MIDQDHHAGRRLKLGARIAMAMTLAGVVAGAGLIERDALAEQDASAHEALEGITTEHLRGTVHPIKHISLGAPLDAMVASVEVEQGSVVRKGELLVQMNDELQSARTRAARQRAEQTGQLEQARVARERAETELERLTLLRVREAASDWELLIAELGYREALAQLQSVQEQQDHANAEYELEQRRLQEYRMEAPFDGLVIRREVEPGGWAGRGEALLEVVALDRLDAELHLPVELYGVLEQGGVYELAAMEPVNASLAGELIMLEPMIDVGSQTFRAVFRIENEDLRWPAGFTVELVGEVNSE